MRDWIERPATCLQQLPKALLRRVLVGPASARLRSCKMLFSLRI